MITLESYLRGEWVKGSGKAATLHDPTSGDAIAETSTAGIDLHASLPFAREHGGPALRAMSFAERGAMIDALSKALHAKRDELLDLSVSSTGTTRSDAKFDVDGAIGTLAYYAGVGKKLGDKHTMLEEPEQLTRGARFYGAHLWTSRIGVALHINAFNFPSWGLAEKLAVSLLAGVPVVSKPATSTALLTYRVGQILVEANVLPRGAFQLICGSVGDLVDQLGPQDVLAFTGSADTAAKLRASPSVVKRSTRVNIEADSLNAAVVAPDVEVGGDVFMMFIRDVAREMTQKTGQKCTATRRLFVPAAICDAVVERLKAELDTIKVGDPKRDDVRMGPLTTAQQLTDFREGVAKLVAGGARLVHGDPERCDAIGVEAGKGYFVSPILLVADKPEEALVVHQHEVFGPCATVLPYQDSAQAARLVAMGEGGLVCSLYGDDRDMVRELTLAIAPWHGRMLLGSSKVADQAIPPGMVLPSCVHGGPGRAGGGEELGGERGMRFYMQRTALQGDRAILEKLFA